MFEFSVQYVHFGSVVVELFSREFAENFDMVGGVEGRLNMYVVWVEHETELFLVDYMKVM